jgi:hypothetical protein
VPVVVCPSLQGFNESHRMCTRKQGAYAWGVLVVCAACVAPRGVAGGLISGSCDPWSIAACFFDEGERAAV